MKQVLFLSPSRFSHLVVGQIVQSTKKNSAFTGFADWVDFVTSPVAHPVHVLIVDHAILTQAGVSEHEITRVLQSRFLKPAKKILVHARGAVFDEGCLRGIGFCCFLTKPFLPEELMEMVQRYLKG